MALRKLVWLRHLETGRRVPVEVPTVFGRSDSYYHYTQDDIRPDRLRTEVTQKLAALNYIKLCSDDQVSRTHGLLDPSIPALCDLNSTNGTQLNEQDLPSRDGEAGPLVTLANRDMVQVGRGRFEVILAEVSEDEVKAQVEHQRHAFVGSGREKIEQAGQIRDYLRDERGFSVRDAVGWAAVIANLYHLQSNAHPEGLALCGLVVEARGYELFMDGEPMPIAKLIPLLTTVPGRKLLLLVVDGDPTSCEHYFASEGYEDMVLLTSPVGGLRESDSNLIVPTLQSMRIGGDEGDSDRRLDNPLDALSALIGGDTNILDCSWVERHEGQLKIVFGTKVHTDEHALSHSLRLGSSTFRF